MKRNTLRILAGALLACTLGAQAQTAYPTQPVKWVVPYAPGGTTDVIARSLAVRMGQDLGQPVVVDNKPGAASIIGATFIARSAADGYTVGTADSGTLAFNPAMYSALSYNAEKDFSFIGGLGRMPLVLAVHPDFPARNMQEFLAQVRKSPGSVSSASSGPGSPLHVALELFKQRTGTNILHVPYKGSAPALQDLMAGQVQSMFVDLPPSLSMIKAGKVRVLAVATPQRLSILPDVPTAEEAGVPGFISETWYGILGPAGLPADRVAILHAAAKAALEDAETRRVLLDQGGRIVASNPDEFGAFIRSAYTSWGEVVRATGMRLE